MKKKGLLLLLVALLCLLFVTPVNKQAKAAAGDITASLVTDSTTLKVGDQIVIASADSTKVLSVNQKTNNRAAVSATLSNEKLVITSDVQILTLEEGTVSGTYALNAGNGYLYAASSTSNYLRTGDKNDNASWVISVSNEATSIVAQGENTRNTFRYNANNGSPIFACYASNATIGTNVVIYKLDASFGSKESIQQLVSTYDNEGNYTKKSYINVSEAAFAEIQGFDINSLFVGGARLDRTTYYWPTELLMTEIDGDFEGYNSGYGTDDNGNLTQFNVDAAGNKLSEKFSANKSHPNWDDTNKDGMEGFYVTLDDMLADGYFEGWDYSEGTATYKVESNKDAFAKDFVAFVAPCLEPIMVEETYENYFIIDKLEIVADDHYIFGKHLRFRIYVGSDCSGTVDNKDLVLAEAHIYVGNEKQFDENIDVRPTLTLEALEIIKDQFDGQTFPGNKALTEKTKTNGYENYDPYVYLTWTYDDGTECPDVIEATEEEQELTLNVVASLGDYVSEPMQVTFIIEAKEAQAQSLLAVFEFGANGSASHSDGSSASTYTETNSGYTLNITSGTNLYEKARDAKGNSCLKFGTSSKAGSMTFTVADDVNYVVIYVAAYKAKTASVTINGTKTALTTKSDNGQYDVIVIDTTTTKTISFNVSSGYRAMVNTIEFYSSYPEGK